MDLFLIIVDYIHANFQFERITYVEEVTNGY